MKTEKPLEIRKFKAGKRSHSTETRVFARNIHEIFCTQPKCEFNGQHAQQGICYSNKPDIIDWDRLQKQEETVEAELLYYKKKMKKGYTRWLEAMYVSSSLNWQITLDEVIRLRRDNALFRLKAKRK